ncbi:unnamed protein product, partial [marine sediment metagenome]
MRCWIIGNGKSLRETPLGLLEDEVTFGVNRIHKFYEFTSWRPTYYVRMEIDPIDWRAAARYHAEEGIRCYLASHIAHSVAETRRPDWPLDNVVAVRMNCAHVKSSYSYGKRAEEWHLPQLCCFGSVVGVTAQIAVLEGVEQIIFVGCDLGYNEQGLNHFDDEYGNWNEMNQRERNETETHMHEIIKTECDRRGVEV